MMKREEKTLTLAHTCTHMHTQEQSDTMSSFMHLKLVCHAHVTIDLSLSILIESMAPSIEKNI